MRHFIIINGSFHQEYIIVTNACALIRISSYMKQKLTVIFKKYKLIIVVRDF